MLMLIQCWGGAKVVIQRYIQLGPHKLQILPSPGQQFLQNIYENEGVSDRSLKKRTTFIVPNL